MALHGDRLLLHTGDLTSELRSLGEASSVIWNPPLAGALIQFDKEGPGEPAFVFKADSPAEADEYRLRSSVPEPPPSH